MDLWTEDWFYLVFFRYGHVLSGITWIGLLYYFNFVQTPSFALMEAPARMDAIQKLVPRALWWFRWGAVSTVAFGILLILTVPGSMGDYFGNVRGHALWLGMIFALAMFANVWMFIWPNQRIIIANAQNVSAGGEADPRVPEATRRSGLASRTNTFLSIAMLFFMIVAGHGGFSRDVDFEPSSGKTTLWYLLVLVWTLIVEANALGYLGGIQPGPTRKFLDTHKDTLIYGAVHAVIWIILFQMFFVWFE
jgi:uncharacterized membrane protein